MEVQALQQSMLAFSNIPEIPRVSRGCQALFSPRPDVTKEVTETTILSPGVLHKTWYHQKKHQESRENHWKIPGKRSQSRKLVCFFGQTCFNVNKSSLGPKEILDWPNIMMFRSCSGSRFITTQRPVTKGMACPAKALHKRMLLHKPSGSCWSKLLLHCLRFLFWLLVAAEAREVEVASSGVSSLWCHP